MKDNRIALNLWFHTEKGEVAPVLGYYRDVFGPHFSAGDIISLGSTPGGNAEMCEVTLFGHRYVLLATASAHHPFNDSLSLMLSCRDQEEIDRYWDYFTREGEESQCGWCIDRYGLRWQVLPENMGELMSRPGAFDIMMRQKRIVIAEYVYLSFLNICG